MPTRTRGRPVEVQTPVPLVRKESMDPEDPIKVGTADGGRLQIPRDGVYIANVSPGQVTTGFTRSLLDLVGYDQAHSLGLWRGNLWGESGANISKARNEMVQRFLDQSDGDWLLMVDSDMVFPPETILRLLACAQITGAKLVGGLCVTIGELGPIPTLFQMRDDAVTGVQFDYPDEAQVQVAATGTACLMVHREVFEAWQSKARSDREWLLGLHDADESTARELIRRDLVRDPAIDYGWFAERVRLKRQPGDVSEHWISEDVDFCLRMGALGYRIFVDTTLEIGHAKHGRIWYPRHLREGVGMPKPAVVAVIPVKDRLDLTSPIVHQLRTQGDCDEIIICDNGSKTETKNWLSTQTDVTVFDMPDVGIHEMWNRGINHALETHGPRTHVAFLNNDLELGPAFLRTLSQALTDHRDMDAVCGNYDGRTADTDVVHTTDICAGRYDGTGGFAGFAFMVRGEWLASGYRFPEDCKWWYGDNDLLSMIALADRRRGMDDKDHKAGIVINARVEHLDGGSQTSNGAGEEFRRQTEADREAFEARWAAIAEQATDRPVAGNGRRPPQPARSRGPDGTEARVAGHKDLSGGRMVVTDLIPVRWPAPDLAGRGDALFEDVAARLNDAGLTWVVAGGTALGLHRDDQLIDTDTDIDIEVLGHDGIEDRLREVFADLPLAITCHWDGAVQQMIYYPDEIIVDVHVCWPDQNAQTVSCVHMGGRLTHPYSQFEDRDLRATKLGEVPFPGNIEDYLSYRYGPDWRTPIYRGKGRYEPAV